MNNNYNDPKTSTPPYIAYYGMTRDPFSQKIENDLFYAEPSRKQRLGTLLHLTQFGNELMIVTGPKGSGKTALLKKFIEISPKSWKFAHIETQGGLDERKILQQLYRQMGMEFRGATYDDLLEQMKIQFDLSQRKGQYSIMLINDADQLPVTAINKVMEMASIKSTVNKPLLRVILFGTEAITDKFADPLLSKYSNLPQRTMELPAFNEEQTTQYVLGRLAAANFVNDDLFTPSVLHKLHTESYGWPAQINELARNILTTSLPKSARESTPEFNTKIFHTSRLFGLLFTIGVVVTFFVFKNEINQWIDQSINTTNDTPSTTLAPKTKPAPATTLVEKLKQRNLAHTPKTNNASTVTPEAPPSKIKPTVKHETKTVQSPLLAVDTSTIPRKESWILDQNPRHYTLQIVAGENLKTIEEFIGEHKLFNNIAFYRSARNGKPWYGLIYGIYPDKQAATSAINQLSKKLQRLKPWVRSINGIKTDINKTRP